MIRAAPRPVTDAIDRAAAIAGDDATAAGAALVSRAANEPFDPAGITFSGVLARAALPVGHFDMSHTDPEVNFEAEGAPVSGVALVKVARIPAPALASGTGREGLRLGVHAADAVKVPGYPFPVAGQPA